MAWWFDVASATMTPMRPLRSGMACAIAVLAVTASVLAAGPGLDHGPVPPAASPNTEPGGPTKGESPRDRTRPWERVTAVVDPTGQGIGRGHVLNCAGRRSMTKWAVEDGRGTIGLRGGHWLIAVWLSDDEVLGSSKPKWVLFSRDRRTSIRFVVERKDFGGTDFGGTDFGEDYFAAAQPLRRACDSAPDGPA